MQRNHPLNPRQFHFLKALIERPRDGGVIRALIEEATCEELSNLQFYKIAERLIRRSFVIKRKRPHSTICTFTLTSAGRELLSLYEPPQT